LPVRILGHGQTARPGFVKKLTNPLIDQQRLKAVSKVNSVHKSQLL
jgi:hypothetical protein